MPKNRAVSMIRAGRSLKPAKLSCCLQACSTMPTGAMPSRPIRAPRIWRRFAPSPRNTPACHRKKSCMTWCQRAWRSEGKWFAVAKDAGLFDVAIDWPRAVPTDPRTLTRAARDYAEKQPEFAPQARRVGWISLAAMVMRSPAGCSRCLFCCDAGGSQAGAATRRSMRRSGT